jgi:hypothetical protein
MIELYDDNRRKAENQGINSLFSRPPLRDGEGEKGGEVVYASL